MALFGMFFFEQNIGEANMEGQASKIRVKFRFQVRI
jgi:hypothetical protein